MAAVNIVKHCFEVFAVGFNFHSRFSSVSVAMNANKTVTH